MFKVDPWYMYLISPWANREVNVHVQEQNSAVEIINSCARCNISEKITLNYQENIQSIKNCPYLWFLNGE